MATCGKQFLLIFEQTAAYTTNLSPFAKYVRPGVNCNNVDHFKAVIAARAYRTAVTAGASPEAAAQATSTAVQRALDALLDRLRAALRPHYPLLSTITLDEALAP